MRHVASFGICGFMEGRNDRLRKARESAGYGSAAKAAAALGINASTYRAHENGQNDFGYDEAERYGRLFRVPATWLVTGQSGGNGSSRPELLTKTPKTSEPLALVPVLGFVKAGYWQDIDEWGAATMDDFVPSAGEYPVEWQYAYTVDGDSLNKIARNGDRLICLDLAKSGAWYQDGDLVIVERSRFNGQMVERTAKRARRTGFGFELWPESDSPEHQAPIPLRSNDVGSETETVTVTAKVLWILRKP